MPGVIVFQILGELCGGRRPQCQILFAELAPILPADVSHDCQTVGQLVVSACHQQLRNRHVDVHFAAGKTRQVQNTLQDGSDVLEAGHILELQIHFGSIGEAEAGAVPGFQQEPQVEAVGHVIVFKFELAVGQAGLPRHGAVVDGRLLG